MVSIYSGKVIQIEQGKSMVTPGVMVMSTVAVLELTREVPSSVTVKAIGGLVRRLF